MKNVNNQASTQIRSQVIRRLSEWLTNNKISEKVWKQVKGKGWNPLGYQITDQVWNQVGTQVRNQLWDQVKENIKL